MQIREIKINFYSFYFFAGIFYNSIRFTLTINQQNELINWQNTENNFKSTNCCEDVMIIDSTIHPEGYLKAPPLYDELNDPRNSNKVIDCVYKFYGQPGERIQLFYEDFDLYYPYDVHKFNRIDCRYSDSICLKFYEKNDHNLKDKPKESSKQEAINIESHNYDLCNCINITYTPRQIISASNFIQVRFKSVKRLFDTSAASLHSKNNFRGYLLRYKFTKDFGLEIKESGLIDKNGDCKIYFYSKSKREGYFSSPNYPGLYPRDLECHYYFIGQKTERVQITFHTFDIEGVEQCQAETKSDFVELSNFQNRDRFYSRFCGANKPGSIVSDGSFFHVTFYSNNVFDGKGFQASYYFISTTSNENKKKEPKSIEKNLVSPLVSSSSIDSANNENKAIKLEAKLITNMFFYYFVKYISKLYIN